MKKVQGEKGDVQITVVGHTQIDFIADLFANTYEDLQIGANIEIGCKSGFLRSKGL